VAKCYSRRVPAGRAAPEATLREFITYYNRPQTILGVKAGFSGTDSGNGSGRRWRGTPE
jgi:hypothetical protein